MRHLLEAYCISQAITGRYGTAAMAAQGRNLVNLYEAWGRPQQAEVYRTEASAESTIEEASPN